MIRSTFLFCITLFCGQAFAQVMTPELLWELQRVGALGLTKDGKSVIYQQSQYDIDKNKSAKTYWKVNLDGGAPTQLESVTGLTKDTDVSPNGLYRIEPRQVKVDKVSGVDFYPEMKKSDVYIYDQLQYRHWDTWEDGKYSHLILTTTDDTDAEWDIMDGEPYSCPTEPFGGPEDYTWSPDSKHIVYVTKKESGTEYTQSTNTDIYSYNVRTKQTENLTEGNDGYDTAPQFSEDGTLAYLQMDEPGYESDKNDLMVIYEGEKMNLTEQWDGTVRSFLWGKKGKDIYFNAPVDGTIQLFKVNAPCKKGDKFKVEQITDGVFNVAGLVGQSGNELVVTRTDMNHAVEIFKVNLRNGKMQQLSKANSDTYANIGLSKIEKRYIKTTDGKDMLTWVIYPPDFDPSKKYPTLLYCQGGPQSPLSQFYSFRWNFQLMAANGYIVVAPNRRGMPGHGVEWNEQISGDWGGQNIKDYLSAIDALAKEDYVDENRLGAVGASYGGFSVFYLAGIHDNRFKSFIAHDGVFNTRSMYGTTEELFFVNKDMGGPYWKKENARSYEEYNPVSRVDQWNTPILIIQGGKDYRVPIGQGLEAFQAAQLNGVKSKLLYFPDENHWILSCQNGIIWQREFFKWLGETI